MIRDTQTRARFRGPAHRGMNDALAHTKAPHDQALRRWLRILADANEMEPVATAWVVPKRAALGRHLLDRRIAPMSDTESTAMS